MPSHYVVLLLVPDAIAAEVVNIGIITYTEAGEFCIRELGPAGWLRAEAFAGRNLDFAKDSIRLLREKINATNIVSIVQEMGTWYMGSLRCTTPRGSLLGCAELMEQISKDFLHDLEPVRQTLKAD